MFSAKFVIVSMLINSALSLNTEESNRVCKVNDSRKSTGICKPLTDCPAVIGLLRAGVSPTRCSVPGPAMVCCPSEKRISSEKCDEFMKILTEPIKPKQALEFDGNRNLKISGDNSIKCESFLQVFISGGVNAKLREYPYQVALGYGEKPDWRCGGTLIDESFVLTAGHCVRTVFGAPIVVLVGDRKLSSKHDVTRKLVKVSEIYVHPKYHPPIQYNDIAIIKLESPVLLSRGVLPACLADPTERVDRAIGVQATGFGRTGAFDSQSDQLKAVTLAKFDTEECASFFRNDNTNKARLPAGIIRAQFCAGDKKGLRDTCQGDSGGPVTVEHSKYSCIRYLVGITSFGAILCGYQQPGVYTNVLSYLDWIEDIVWRNLTMSERSKLYSKVSVVNSTGSNSSILILDPITSEQSSTSATTLENTNSHVINISSTPSSKLKTSESLLTTSEATTSSSAPNLTFSTQTSNVITPKSTEARVLPSIAQMNHGYSFLNISSTVAALLNKFSIGR